MHKLVKDMKVKFKKIISGNFIRNVLTLVCGTASVQIITALFSPVITRIYGPEAIY